MKNFKKIFALITVICMLTTTMTVVFADEATFSLPSKYIKNGDFYYEILTEPADAANGTVKLFGLTEDNYSTIIDVVIPATVTIADKVYDVVELADAAFFKDGQAFDTNNDGKVDTSDSLNKELFGTDYCSKVTSFTFAEDSKLQTIGSSCLASIVKVDEIIFPDCVTTLGFNNFYNNGGIKYVHLPAKLTSVPGALFSGCQNLRTVDLPTEGFTTIPQNAFRSCAIDYLVIPDNITAVGKNAFIPTNTSSFKTTTVKYLYGTSSNGAITAIASTEGVNVEKVYATNFDYYVLDEENKKCAVTGVKSGTSLSGVVYMADKIDGYTVTALMYDEGRWPLDPNTTDSEGRQKITNTNAPHLFIGQSNITEFYMPDTIERIMGRQASNEKNGYAEANADGTVKCNEPINDETWGHYYSIFYNCSKLEKLHLSDNLTGRVRGLLPTTTLVKEIEIPDGVTIIDRCFRKQTNLKSIRTTENSKLQKIIGGGNGSFDGCAGIEEFVILGSELEQFNPFYLIATTREDVIAKNPNLTIFTDNEEYAASTGILGMFANSYNFKISTDVDTQVMVDKVETSESGVTATLRSRAYGFNKSADGESVKVICAVYNSNDTLAKIDTVDKGFDFTNSLLQEVTFDGITVADDQNVKVFVWQNTSGAAPSTDAYDLKGDKRNIKYYAIGHSYLYHGSFVGWQTTGIWGMAATEPQYDYFHQVQKNLVDNLDCEVIALPEPHSNYERLCNGSATEETYTSSSDYIQMKKVIKDSQPNVITIAFGCNATNKKPEPFGQFYDVLFKMVSDTIAEVNEEDSNANYDPVVVFVPVFDNEIVAGVPAAEKYGFIVADVSFIHDNGSVAEKSNPYYAFTDYPDYDPSMNRNVEFRTHPGNLGHKAIADTIFRAAKDEILKKIPANNDVTTDYDDEYGYAEYGTGNGGGTATEIKITTNPKDMKVNFNGFNVMRDDTNDWVVLSSADSGASSTGASVSAKNLSISSDYNKFYVTIRVDGEISGKNMLFKYTTASGTQTMTLPMVEGIHTYEFDISGVTEEITSVEVTPDLSKCTLYIRSMCFEK